MSRIGVVHISWYLCVLFLFGLLMQSAISVAPGGEVLVYSLMGTSAALAVIFAALAVTFMRLGVPGPRWLVRTLHGVAVVATVLVACWSRGG